MKLKVKLSVLVIAIMALIVSGISILLLNRASAMTRQLSIYSVSNLADTRAIYWEGVEDRRFAVLHTLANIMSQYQNIAPEERRSLFEEMLLGVINENPDIINMNTIWKPNAVDGMDARYIGRPGSSPTGQFAPVYTRESGTMQLQVSPDIDGAMAHINGPDALKDRTVSPIAGKVAGKDVYLLRLMVPIVNQRTKEIVGSVGCLLDISTVQQRAELTVKSNSMIGGISIYFNDGFVMASIDPQRIGKNMRDVELMYGDNIQDAYQAVVKGESRQYDSYAPALGERVHIELKPIRIGTSDVTWSIMLMVTENYMLADVRQLTMFTILAAIIAIAAAAIIIYFALGLTTNPIVTVSEKLRDIAEGEGDLTKTITAKSKDEIGDLALNFNKTLGNIRNLVATIKYKVNALTNTGYELSVNMDKTAKAVDNISTNFESIKGLEKKQKDKSAQVDKALNTIQENINLLKKIIENQTESVNTSSSAIEEMTANIHSVSQTLIENSKNVEDLSKASEYGRTALQTVAQEIQEIAKDSEGLLEINLVMNKIASQTNLLSMNAAIEAAHAGETGKGFAVVADEIRKLAVSSAEQSKTTSAMLKKIKTSIDNITKSSDEVLSRFGAIDNGVKTVAEHESNIRNAMEEQEVGGKQILDAVGRLKEITVSVQEGSRNMSKSGDDLNRETGEFIKISNEALSGMNEIVDGALKEITVAVSHVTEMSTENNKNFEGLKSETIKFKTTTGEEKPIILVIDDDKNHLTMTKSFLEEDYDVVTSQTCDEALKLLYQGLAPVYILLDLMMPDVSGWDTYESIRGISNLHKVPIAIFTSSDDPKDMEYARKMKAADYIKKPCRKGELLERIKNNIAKSA